MGCFISQTNTHGLKDLELFTSDHIRMDPRTADFGPCSMDG